MIFKKIKNPGLGIFWGGGDGQGEASQRRFVHNWGKKRVEKQNPTVFILPNKNSFNHFWLKNYYAVIYPKGMD